MKNIFILLSFFAFQSFLYSQKLVVEYIEERNLFDLPPALLQMQGIELGSNIYKEKSTLLIYSVFSLYRVDSFYFEVDYISKPFKAYLRPRVIIKDYRNKKLYKHDSRLDSENQMTLSRSSEDLDWQIDRKKKKYILGVPCYYAWALKKSNMGSSTIEAWFAEDIPYSDCPDKRYAMELPGLVLQLEDKSRNKTITATSIYSPELKAPQMVLSDWQIVDSDMEEKNAYYRSLDRSSPYILSEQTPQSVWLPYPKE